MQSVSGASRKHGRSGTPVRTTAKARPAGRMGGAGPVCPFTLEPVRSCARRKLHPRPPCLFSLEKCLSTH